MQAVAVPVHLVGEVRELLPTFELGAIVERHHDELRRPVDAGLRGRVQGKGHQSRKYGRKRSRGHFSPPTERLWLAILIEKAGELISSATINDVENCNFRFVC